MPHTWATCWPIQSNVLKVSELHIAINIVLTLNCNSAGRVNNLIIDWYITGTKYTYRIQHALCTIHRNEKINRPGWHLYGDCYSSDAKGLYGFILGNKWTLFNLFILKQTREKAGGLCIMLFCSGNGGFKWLGLFLVCILQVFPLLSRSTHKCLKILLVALWCEDEIR